MKALNLPGLLIEYIINGAIAFIWIYLLVINFSEIDNLNEKYNNIFLLLSVPVAYILGMLVDLTAYFLIRGKKKGIQNFEMKRILNDEVENNLIKEALIKTENRKSFTDKLIIMLNIEGLENLAEEIKWRSSRNRIARGYIVNNFLIGFTIALIVSHDINAKLNSFNSLGALITIILISASLSLGLYFLWKHFEKLSYRFQLLTYIKVLEQQTKKNDNYTSEQP